MKKILKRLKLFVTKKYVRTCTYFLCALLVMVFSFSMTWAWFTNFVVPKTPQNMLSIDCDSVTISQLKIEAFYSEDDSEVKFDLNDDDLNDVFTWGYALDQEYTFTIGLHSDEDGCFAVDVGFTGIDGGECFDDLDGNPTEFNMCDVFSFKLESINHDSNPAYSGSYEYRKLSDAKDNGGSFMLVKNFYWWDTLDGDIVFTFKMKISTELVQGIIDTDILSLKTLDVSQILVSAKRVGG